MASNKGLNMLTKLEKEKAIFYSNLAVEQANLSLAKGFVTSRYVVYVYRLRYLCSDLRHELKHAFNPFSDSPPTIETAALLNEVKQFCSDRLKERQELGY